MVTTPSCEWTSSFAHVLVDDVACHCDMNCVRSKDKHKQLRDHPEIKNGLFHFQHTSKVAIKAILRAVLE